MLLTLSTQFTTVLASHSKDIIMYLTNDTTNVQLHSNTKRRTINHHVLTVVSISAIQPTSVQTTNIQ
jgi:H+/gluconate symporter-like permease